MGLTTNGINDAFNTIADGIIDDWTQMAIGSGTTAESVSDTMLVLQAARKNVTDTDKNTGEVILTGIFDTTEANGVAITEVGLMKSDRTLMVRRLTEAFNKTSSITLYVDVTIEIEVVEVT